MVRDDGAISHRHIPRHQDTNSARKELHIWEPRRLFLLLGPHAVCTFFHTGMIGSGTRRSVAAMRFSSFFSWNPWRHGCVLRCTLHLQEFFWGSAVLGEGMALGVVHLDVMWAGMRWDGTCGRPFASNELEHLRDKDSIRVSITTGLGLCSRTVCISWRCLYEGRVPYRAISKPTSRCCEYHLHTTSHICPHFRSQ